MERFLATIFLALIIAGVAKMIFDVQLAKLKKTFDKLLKILER